MSEWVEWSRFLRRCAEELMRLVGPAVMGTLMLLAFADDRTDGDELFKGPVAGWSAYGADRAYKRIRGADQED